MKYDTVYIAMYNPMIYESSFGVISIHKTRKGAEMAIEFDREERRKEWLEMYPSKKEQEEYEFGKFESWLVREDCLLS